MTTIKRIGVLTSGGDAPGMNAAVRAVVRSALNQNIQVYGIYTGYAGLITGEFKELHKEDVSGIIQTGGTILKTARSDEFRTPEGRQKAYDNLKKYQIDGVVAIGGDGTFTGANIMQQEHNIPFIGIPGTIDNDIYGTEYTIGYDTALNTVVQAVDKIKETASSHNRVFFVEVMGREAGFVALRSGIAVGAEGIVIPEIKDQHKKVINFLEKNQERPRSSIFIVAEGDEEGHAIELANKVRDQCSHYDVRVSIIGHIQRGGSPSCYDRVTASRMGAAAVKALTEGRKNIMIGLQNDKIDYESLENTVKMNKSINQSLVELTDLLI
jgi:6-phosphofructokinase 1